MSIIRIETGPHARAPYRSWKFWELSARAVLDQRVFEDELRELNQFLGAIDTHVDPRGSFTQQVQKAILQVEQTGESVILCLAGAGERPMYEVRKGNDPWDLDVNVRKVE